jgi:hypothetical protein
VPQQRLFQLSTERFVGRLWRGMFYHAVHLLTHASAMEGGVMGLHPAQFCALSGYKDAGVVCTCAARVLSCPEPSIVGTTKGLKVEMPELGNKASVKSWLASHPNNAYLVRPCACARVLFSSPPGLRCSTKCTLAGVETQACARAAGAAGGSQQRGIRLCLSVLINFPGLFAPRNSTISRLSRTGTPWAAVASTGARKKHLLAADVDAAKCRVA